MTQQNDPRRGAAGQFAGLTVTALSRHDVRVRGLVRTAEQGDRAQRLGEAVVRSGARRIVFSSVIHPVLAELANHAAKAPVEAAIINSGLEYILLHPALYFVSGRHRRARVDACPSDRVKRVPNPSAGERL